MSDELARIKRTVLSGRYLFTEKARTELAADGLTELDAIEAITGAVAIYKTLRSRSPHRQHRREKLYVIQGTNLEGIFIYTKGKFGSGPGGVETFYVLISAKRSAAD